MVSGYSAKATFPLPLSFSLSLPLLQPDRPIMLEYDLGVGRHGQHHRHAQEEGGMGAKEGRTPAQGYHVTSVTSNTGVTVGQACPAST